MQVLFSCDFGLKHISHANITLYADIVKCRQFLMLGICTDNVCEYMFLAESAEMSNFSTYKNSHPKVCQPSVIIMLKQSTLYISTEIFYRRPVIVIEVQQKSSETAGDCSQGSQLTKTSQVGYGRYIHEECTSMACMDIEMWSVLITSQSITSVVSWYCEQGCLYHSH